MIDVPLLRRRYIYHYKIGWVYAGFEALINEL